jgi:hypothetical protein
MAISANSFEKLADFVCSLMDLLSGVIRLEMFVGQ